MVEQSEIKSLKDALQRRIDRETVFGHLYHGSADWLMVAALVCPIVVGVLLFDERISRRLLAGVSIAVPALALIAIRNLKLIPRGTWHWSNSAAYTRFLWSLKFGLEPPEDVLAAYLNYHDEIGKTFPARDYERTIEKQVDLIGIDKMVRQTVNQEMKNIKSADTATGP